MQDDDDLDAQARAVVDERRIKLAAIAAKQVAETASRVAGKKENTPARGSGAGRGGPSGGGRGRGTAKGATSPSKIGPDAANGMLAGLRNRR